MAKGTILSLLVRMGEACTAYQNENLVDLPSKVLQLDEIWSFVGCKEKAKAKAKGRHPGDVWTWTALCADTKIVPSWLVADRSGASAYEFCADLSKRFSGDLQITTDGLSVYRWAIGGNFKNVDYAQLIKIYDKDANGQDIVTGCEKKAVLGSPDMNLVSTSFVERQNLTIRMSNRRFTRLTNAFSKKLENHAHMMAVHFMNYNYARKHATIKTSPAIEAGVTGQIWTMGNIVDMMDEHHEAKENAKFEEAFSRLKQPRQTAKAFEPATPLTPWYLDPESGGPNPEMKKEGVRYPEDEFPF